MATFTGSQKDITDMVHDLCELDYDAIEAYEAAIQRLKDQNDRSQLHVFLADHQRHVNDLSVWLSSVGIAAPVKGDLKRVLTRGKVVLGSLMGDKAVHEAMKDNEDDTNKAYERAVAHAGMPSDLLTIIRRNLDDERRHRAWFEARIAAYRMPRSYESRPSRPSHP